MKIQWSDDEGETPAAAEEKIEVENEKRQTLLALSFFLGVFGVDRFYVGKIGTGILKLLTFGGFGIWWIIDICLISGDKFPIKGYREATEQEIAGMKEEERREQEKERQKQQKKRQKQLIATAEYKRTCKSCGSIWHSSVAQENSGPGTAISWLGLGAAVSMGILRSTAGAIIAFSQFGRVQDKEAAHENYQHSVRHCPKCGSGSYYEEVVSYG